MEGARLLVFRRRLRVSQACRNSGSDQAQNGTEMREFHWVETNSLIGVRIVRYRRIRAMSVRFQCVSLCFRLFQRRVGRGPGVTLAQWKRYDK